MSCVCILAPVVVAAWPAFSAAVVAAATSLGYQVAAEPLTNHSLTTAEQDQSQPVKLEVPQSELVTGTLGRAQRLSVARDGVTVTFARNARGKAEICVSGEGRRPEELRALGQELSQRVVQQYVYQRLMEEMRARRFVVVEEEVDATQAIRLKVRHWEG